MYIPLNYESQETALAWTEKQKIIFSPILYYPKERHYYRGNELESMRENRW